MSRSSETRTRSRKYDPMVGPIPSVAGLKSITLGRSSQPRMPVRCRPAREVIFWCFRKLSTLPLPRWESPKRRSSPPRPKERPECHRG